MQYLQKFIQFSILAGIVTHPIWNWSFKAVFIPKPSDFFFALAIAGSIFYFFGEGRNNLGKIPKLLYAALFLFGASIVLGTTMGYFRYGIPVGGWHAVLYYLVRIGGGFILCLFLYASLGDVFRFRKWIYGAFAVSSLIFIPFLVLPFLAERFSMLSGDRFFGLAGNAGMFAILIFPSFVFSFFIFLRALFAPNIKKRALWLVSFGFVWLAVEMLILWSGTRSYFGAIILTVIIGAILLGLFYRVGVKKLFVSSVLIWFAAFLPLFLFSDITYRFGQLGGYPAIFRELGESAQEIQDTAELQTQGGLSEIPQVQFTSMDSRLSGFQYYFSLLRADPLAFILGLGINFEHKFGLLIVSGDSGGLYVGRSIIFDIFLYGGMGAAIAVAILAWMVWQRVKILFKQKEKIGIEPIYILAPAVTLLGWWSAAVFLGTPLILIPNWILLGLVLAKSKA